MLSNFIYATKKSLFEAELSKGNILSEAVVFIADTKEIWNHGTYFGTSEYDPVAFAEIQRAVSQLDTNKLDKTEASGLYALKTDVKTYSAGTGLSLDGNTFNHDDYVTSEGTAGTANATSGNTIAIPYITYNKQGHITGSGTHTHTITGFTNNTGTVTSITPGTGLTGTSSDAAITTTGTINLKTAGTSEIGGVKIGKDNSSYAVTTQTSSINADVTSGKYYAIEVDKNDKAFVYVPWTDTNTDTKVTSVDNHYTPAEDTSAAISAASGAATNITGTGGKLNVVTGLKRDAKGHIVGVTSANIYSTDNNSTSFTITAEASDDDVVVLSGTNGTNKVTYSASHAKKFSTSGNTYTSGNSTTSISGSGASGVIKIPQITVDAYGHITAAADESVTITMPTIPSLSGGSAAESGKYVSGVTVNGHAVTVTKGTLPTVPSSLKNPNALTFGSKSYDGSSAQTITAADLGLGNALKFHGTSKTAITDGSTTQTITLSNDTSHTAENGCVVFYGNKEFVWNGTSWEELGNEGNYKVKQSSVSSPATSGSTTEFIDTISQDVNGVITATKKSVTFPTYKTLTVNNSAGTAQVSFNGSTDKSLTLTKAMVGLGNVDNTADANKSVASAGTATYATKLGDSSSSYTKSSLDTALAGKLNTSGGTLTGSLTFIMGNEDRFINFLYNNSTAYSWRIGYLGSGAGDANYLSFQSAKNDGTAWTDALRLGNDTLDASFAGNILPLANNSKSLGSSNYKWSNVHATTFTGNLSGTATTATNLASAPSLAASGNNITVTAGGKTSSAFTVPYATSAGSATDQTARDAASAAQSTANGKWTYNADEIKTVKVNNAGNADILKINNIENKSVSRLQYFQKNNDTTINPDSGWWSLLRTQHSGYENGYWQEMAYSFSSDTVKYRRNVNGTKSAWKTFAFTDSNITGNASTATALTSSAGSATNPIYFSGGKPVACTYTLGKSVPSDAKFTDTDTWRTIQCNGTSIGSNTLNLKAGTNVSLSNSNGTITISSTNTTYSSKAAASGGTDVSLVTTGEKYTWNSKQNAISDLATIRSNATNGNTAYSWGNHASAGYVKSSGVTSVATGAGLTGGTISSTGTIKVALKSETKSALEATAMGSTSNRQYAVGLDKNGVLSVNVPWTENTNTTYTFAGGTNGFTVTPSGGTAQTVSVTPSISNNVTYTGSPSANSVAIFNSTNGVIKPSGYTIAKSVPADAKFTDTTYSAGTGLSLSGTTFSANGTSIINALTEGASPATREDFIVAQWAGGGTTITSYHRRKLSHIFAALNKSDITTALGYTPPTSDTNTWRPIYNGVDSTATDTSASANAVKTAYDKAVSAYNLANGKTSNTGTVTSVATGVGLTGGTISTSGTIKCNLNSETSLGTIGTTSKLYAVGVDTNGKLCVNVPWSDNNTHYTSKNIVGTSATATSNGAVTGTGGVFLNHLEESTVKSTHKIVGAGTVKVTSDGSGNITITGTDTNTDTHYTTGINAGASGATSNSVQTNPYITVKDNSTYRSQIRLVGGGKTTVTSDASGNITISSSDNAGVTSVATGTGLTGGTITGTGTISINSTYQGYITNGNNAWASYTTATSIASIPVGYKLVKCTISAAGSFSLASTSITAGREIHIIIYNSSSSEVVVSLPTASPYVNFNADSLTIPANGYAEINVISDGSNLYIRTLA